MIKKVTITNFRGESVTMDLGESEKSDFLLSSIDGLDPGASTLNISENSISDGGQFNSARVSPRPITINIVFSWNRSIEDQRHECYKFFQLKKPITIKIETDKRNVEIDGYVESCSVDIFSSMEGATIGIKCPDPNFYGIERNEFNFGFIDPSFSFPFFTPPDLEFGKISKIPMEEITYSGEIDTGIILKIHAIGNTGSITFNKLGEEGILKIDTDKLKLLTGSGIISGDDIEINTISGKKYARLIRNGIVYNILNCLGRKTNWLKLSSSGSNIIVYDADSGIENIHVSIMFRTVYQGV